MGCRVLFTFFGQFLVLITPTLQMATIAAGGTYTLCLVSIPYTMYLYPI